MPITRRDFLAASLAAGAARGSAERPMLCLFSKHLPKLNYAELGAQVKKFGFDGVDLTVRPQGHVLPERAAADLPRAVETLRDHGLHVPMITTALTSAAHPTARPILSTAAGLKVPFYKLGYWKYAHRDTETVLAAVTRDVHGLFDLSKEYGIVAGFHNHSGDNVGAALWDIRSIIAGLDPRWIGYYFDPCHATAEGGVDGWEISLRMAAPRLKMVALKDFYWAKQNGQWKMTMCPMGEGMVQWSKVFSILAAARFTGPISQHLEYETPDELAAIARDLEFIKKHVAAAYGA
ncbi:MAG TPA: sugar phosphate isomerase/epimerase family protein [Bryobacterales bacterium]|nr:sugar phosphate isomerase/epimerase family protein [Bryobacterales bacterium]